MNSNIVAMHGSVPAFRAKLEALEDLANTLYALHRLAETEPSSFDSFRQIAMNGEGAGRCELFQAWPGRGVAAELQEGAESLLAELHHHALADGAVLCAKSLLDNLRIVGGLYVTANRRDLVTFRPCADQRVVDHWRNAVCESQVEYFDVSDALQA